MSSNFKEVLRYLVVKALTDKNVVKILYDYFVENISPSVLASKYGVSKYQVRGYIQRIADKMSHARARAVIKHVYPYLISAEDIFEYDGHAFFKCKLCGIEIPNGFERVSFAMYDHLTKKHADYIDVVVNRIIDILKQNISRSRC